MHKLVVYECRSVCARVCVCMCTLSVCSVDGEKFQCNPQNERKFKVDMVMVMVMVMYLGNVLEEETRKSEGGYE